MPSSPAAPDNTPNAPVTPWEFLSGGAILLAFLALGEVAAPYLARVSVPVPGSVVGLGLLWAALRLGWVKTAHVAQASRSLLVIMPLLFVPAGVGVFADSKLSGTSSVLLGLAIVGLTIVTLAVIGRATQWWLGRGAVPAELPE